MILRLLAVLAMALTLFSVHVASALEPGAETWGLDVLAGLKTIVVVVNPLSPDADVTGLKADALREAIEKRLRREGIDVLAERPLMLDRGDAMPDWALMKLSVDDIKREPKPDGFHEYWFTLELIQEVQLVRRGGVRSPVSTWSRVSAGTQAADAIAPEVRDTLAGALDEFAAEYRSANGGPAARLPPVAADARAASGAQPGRGPEGD